MKRLQELETRSGELNRSWTLHWCRQKIWPTRKPVENPGNQRYGAFMQALNLQFLNLREKNIGIQIEPAESCDGSRCHQPIFRADGTLNYVAPHCHLVEWSSEGVRYYPVFCDFPAHQEPNSEADGLFVNYPPFRGEKPVAWPSKGKSKSGAR